MTAYTSAVSGDVNVATNWTPNGIPTSADTVTINKMMTIPAGVTFNPTITEIRGTSTANRAGFTVNGALQIVANVPVYAWNHIIQGAGSVIDYLGNSGLRYQSTSGNGENRYSTSGTSRDGWARITKSDYVSGEPASVMSTATVTAAADGLLDVEFLVIEQMASVLYGSGSGTNLMSHFRMKNCIFDDAGFFKTSQFSRLSNDFIFENIDIRHSHPQDISSPFFMELLAERNTAGTPTGIKRFKNVTVKFSNTELSTKYLRFFSADYFTGVQFCTDSVSVRIASSNTGVTYSGTCHRSVTDGTSNSTFGGVLASTSYNNNVYVLDATDYDRTAIGSFHGYESQAISEFNNNFIEEIFLQTGLDGSDWMGLPTSSAVPLNFRNNIIVTQNGGVFINSWKGSTTASVNFEHNTYIAKYANFSESNPYGMFARTESGQRYTGGTFNIRSNIAWVINTAGSSDGKIAVVHFGSTAALSDQIDLFDYNTIYNCSPTPPSGLLNGVTITGKVYGDDGFGANDNYVDPDMSSYPRLGGDRSIILGYASTKGYSTTKALWAGEFLKVNGFNETTRRQELSGIVAAPVEDFLEYARTCVTPSNPLLAGSAHDGTSRGAVQFTPSVDPEGDRGITSIGLTAVGLTASSFTARGL